MKGSHLGNSFTWEPNDYLSDRTSSDENNSWNIKNEIRDINVSLGFGKISEEEIGTKLSRYVSKSIML